MLVSSSLRVIAGIPPFRLSLPPQDHNLLVSELQSLIVESKRRNPEVKDVSLRRPTFTDHRRAKQLSRSFERVNSRPKCSPRRPTSSSRP